MRAMNFSEQNSSIQGSEMNRNEPPLYGNAKRTLPRRPKFRGGLLSGVIGFAVTISLIWAGILPARALNPGALPTGGHIVSGQGTIAASGDNMTVTQLQNQMILNWNTFNIGQDASVTFLQPSASSSALNRILGQNPAEIFGSLKANGRIFLLDPAGIIFGPTARVDVGGLVASSLNLSDSDYLSGNFRFTSTGLQSSVINQGTINAAKYGVVALIAPQVSNQGTISAPGGSVALAGGNRVTLDFTGDGLVKLSVDEAALDAEVRNGGAVKTAAGRVFMTEKAAQDVVSTVVNNSGIIEADSIGTKNGEIVLDGGGQGVVTNSGAINARGNNAGETGGTVTVTGNQVGLLSGSTIDVSGNSGGGTVNIGGGPHGADAGIRNASDVYMDKEASIFADAAVNGNGGQVTIWSQQYTNFAGSISARGGPLGGNGGWVETSSKGVLDASGSVVTLAPLGIAGVWLLDPSDITIITGGGGTLSGGIFDPPVTSSIDPLTIATGLASGNVTIDTSGGSGGSGNITVSNSVSWGSANTLSLEANNNIAVNAAISGTGGGNLVLRADSQGTGTGTVTFGAPGFVSLPGGNVSIYYNPLSYSSPTDYSSDITSGNLFAYMLINDVNNLQNIAQNLLGTYALGKGIDASATSTWNSGAGFVPIGGSSTAFTGVFDGNGCTITGLYIYLPRNNYVGLFGYTSGATIRNVGLINGSITGSNYVGGLVGEADSTVIGNSYNSGTAAVTGNGNNTGGLVGYAQDTTISSSYNTGAVTGYGDSTGGLVGQLVGYNTTAVIDSSYNQGAVSGTTNTGGLVGSIYDNGGAEVVSNSHNTGTVTGSGPYTGGIAGSMQDYGGSASATIVNCNNTGAVSGGHYTGGLVGWFVSAGGSSTISSSSNAANVTGTDYVGGVAGYIVGNGSTPTVTGSYNTGAVTQTDNSATEEPGYGGGLAGYAQNAVISSSYNTGTVIGNGNYTGGLVGYAEDTVINSSSYNTGAVTGYGDSTGGLVGQLVGYNTTAVIDSSYNQGAVSGTTNTGGLVGSIYDNGGAEVVSNSHNTGTVTGSDSYTGGIAGSMEDYGGSASATIVNCNNTGAVSGGHYTGGLVGWFVSAGGSSTISSSSNAANVTGTDYVGGVAGYIVGNGSTPTVTGSYNTGAVTQTDNSATEEPGYGGGLAGYAGNAVISSSYNTGTVTGYGNNIGGLVGYAQDTTISSSHNTGTVGGSGNYTGGLVGQLVGGSATAAIDSSYNRGDVSGNTDTGGLVGYAEDATISSSYNTGAVTGSGDSTGGLVGQLVGYNTTAVIDSSYNQGAVSGTTNTGGLVGYIDIGEGSETVSNSYNTGAVTSTGDNTGGIAGNMSDDRAIVTTSYNTGAISGGGDNVGGLAGLVDFGTVSSSYNTGQVTGYGNNVGGVVGLVNGAVTNTYNLAPVTGGGDVGGVAGYVNGTLTYSFNTGTVTATGAGGNTNVGGVTSGGGTDISTCYFDSQTSGLTGTNGLPTSAMMTQSTFQNWDFTNTWAIVPGTTYPYLKWQQPGGPPIVVSGTISGFATPGDDLIEAVVNGTTLAQVYTGANGFYYFMLPGNSIPTGDNLLTFVSGAGTQGASVYLATGSSMTGLSISASTLLAGSGESTSGVIAAKGGLTDTDIPYSDPSGVNLLLASNINLLTSNFTLDGNITTSGTGSQTFNGALTLSYDAVLTSPGGISFNGAVNGASFNLTLDSTGTVTQAAGITAGGLLLLGTGGNYQLTNSGNSVTTLAADTGVVNYAQAGSLAVGTVNTTQGITASGNVTLAVNGAAGGLTIGTSGGTNGITETGAGNAVSLSSGSGGMSIGGNGIDAGNLAANNTVTLTSTGSVTQDSGAPVIAANLDLLGIGGVYSLANGTNNAVTGDLAADTGVVNYAQTGSLAVGTVNTTQGITASGNVTLAVNGAAAGLTIGTSGGTNGITETGSNKTVALTAGSGGISIGGNGINAGNLAANNTVTLTSTGSVTQDSGAPVIAANLDLLGIGGDYSLANGTNNAVTGDLAADTGVVNYAQAGSLAVGTVNTTQGITASGNVTLAVNGAAGGLTIGTSGGTNGITETGAGNAVSLTSGSGGISIGGNGINAGNLAANNTVTLTSTGSVTQDSGAPVIAANLDLLGIGGDYSLANGTNNAVTGDLAADTGVVNYAQAGSLAVGTVNPTQGITASGNVTLAVNGAAAGLTIGTSGGTNGITETGSNKTVALTAGSGGISIGGNGINAGNLAANNTVTLTSTGSVTQDNGAPVIAANLDLLGIGGDYSLANGTNNAVTGDLAADTGVVNYAQTGSLAVGTVNTTQGITASGNVSLSVAGAGNNLTVGGSGIESAGGNSITLAADTMTLTGTAIQSPGGTLTIEPYTAGTTIGLGSSSASGTLALPQSYFWNGSSGIIQPTFSNVIIGNSAAGTITVGTLTFAGNLTLDPPGGITIDGALNAGNNNTLTLNSTGLVQETASGSITAGALILTGAGGSFTLANLANSVGALSAGTSTTSIGGLDYEQSGSLITNGVYVSGGPATIRGDGGITIQGAGITDSGQTVNLISTGAVTQATGADITAGGLILTGTGGNYQLTNTGNSVTTLAADTGTVNFANSGDLAVGQVGVVSGITTTAGTTVTAGGNITLDSGVTANGIVLAASGNFINNVPASPLNAGTGNWLIYSTDPRLNTLNGIVPAFIQYNAPYPAAVLGSGNGLLYSLAPVVDVSLTGTVAKVYDGTAIATLVPANYTYSGEIGSDIVDLSLPASGVYDNPNVGTDKPVSVSGIGILSASNGGIPVYGYQLASASISADIGTITSAPPSSTNPYLQSIQSSLTVSLGSQNSPGGAQTLNGTSSTNGDLAQATAEGSGAEVETEAPPVGGFASGSSPPPQEGGTAVELIKQATDSQSEGDYERAVADFRGAVGNLLEQGSPAQAREVIELLKTAELEGYYGDAGIGRDFVHKTALKDLPQDAAAVYTFVLPKRLELIVCFRSGIKRFSIPIDAAVLSRDVDKFRISLQRRTSWDYMAEARKLYNLIVRPMEPELSIRGIDTLVFIPDGALRTVPFAALNDGRRFLIEKYALAVAPSLSLTDPRPIRPKQARALAAGLTESVRGFIPLSNVESELEDVHGLYKSALLKNGTFTKGNMSESLEENPYSIVHIATHGNFAPKGTDTFLLAWDGKIDMNQLDRLMKQSKKPVELLCLSACETAAGDDKAALGLAGVAVKAGTRSALATLWSVSDQAAPELIHEFYDQLRNPSVSKAEALREAQLSLLDDPRFHHPYYWSPFLVIGNWR